VLRRTIAFTLLIAAAPAARGQGDSPKLGLDYPGQVVANSSVPTVSMSGILTEGHRQELLHGGWPTAIRARVEVWRRGGVAFGRESDFEWDVIVEYSPASKVYHLRRVVNNQVENLGDASSIEAAEQILRRPFMPPISPRRRGDRYFYVFKVEISTLSMSDLDAWQRWVRGEATPAIRGKRNPAGAFQRGLGSLLSRVLGGDTQTYETRSVPFTAG
jgi:hypothetical protein